MQGLSRLCWDERRVHLDTRDDEELWRLMYRRSGMGRLEFKQALQLGRYSTSLLSGRHSISLSGLGEVHILCPDVCRNG